MQKTVELETKRLLNEGHIEQVNEVKDDVFIQFTVIPVKNGCSVKLALDARALNQAMDKYKNQIRKSEILMDMVAERKDSGNGNAWYSSDDMT